MSRFDCAIRLLRCDLFLNCNGKYQRGKAVQMAGRTSYRRGWIVPVAVTFWVGYSKIQYCKCSVQTCTAGIAQRFIELLTWSVGAGHRFK